MSITPKLNKTNSNKKIMINMYKNTYRVINNEHHRYLKKKEKYNINKCYGNSCKVCKHATPEDATRLYNNNINKIIDLLVI